MTELILYAIIYIIMGFVVAHKQHEAMKDSYDPEASAGMLAIVWPITLTWYIIKVVFFKDWI